jgi:predicted chitinase
MIISPPFLPVAGATSTNLALSDPMMSIVENFELAHGVYPIAFDRRWHTGVHLCPVTQNEKVRAIADGEVVAYRVCQHAIDSDAQLDSNAGFVLLKHTSETGEGRTLTFYSLYMHLLELSAYNSVGVNANELPEFLRMPSPGGSLNPSAAPPAQSGSGKKVSRKDILGLPGRCHGQRHVHFEIFMLPNDFDHYFGATQLGNTQLHTSAGTDYWGHSYYVIPERQTFVAQPPGTVDGKFHGIDFDALQGGLNEQPLHIETYFHRGNKYTSVWSVAQDGSRTPLVIAKAEPEYEYKLYERATKLYPACPSDGYELLRFGRILSGSSTLPVGAARATWIRAAFAAGQEGYIDLNNEKIVKLSDADFPFVAGWKKVDEGNGPFAGDGLCDIDQLKAILGTAKEHQTQQEQGEHDEYQKEEALVRYVRDTTGVRDLLKGFVCQAPSEWDSTNNAARYGKLLSEQGEFYYGNSAGYAKFIDLLKQFQFWDTTQLQAGTKLWFFHPLQFIRHFRKCDWLSLREQIQLLPRRSMPNAGGQILWGESEIRFIDGKNGGSGKTPPLLWFALNHMFRKYGFYGSLRKAHFLGQIFMETGALTSTIESGDATYFTKMYEQYTAQDAAYDFDHKHTWLANLGFLKNRDRPTYIAQRPGEIHDKASANGNVQPGDGPRFCGRGLIHLTWRNSYRDYGLYRDKDFTIDPNSSLLQADAEVAADSAGYFWAKTRINRKADLGSGNQDVQACFHLVGGAGGLSERQQFFRYAHFVLGDGPRMPVEAGLVRQTEDGQ